MLMKPDRTRIENKSEIYQEKNNIIPDVNFNGAESHDVPGKGFYNKSFCMLL